MTLYSKWEPSLRVASVGRDQGHHGDLSCDGRRPRERKAYSFEVRARSLSGGVSAPSPVVTARTWLAWGPPCEPAGARSRSPRSPQARFASSWSASTAPGCIACYDVYQDGQKTLSLPGIRLVRSPSAACRSALTSGSRSRLVA